MSSYIIPHSNLVLLWILLWIQLLLVATARSESLAPNSPPPPPPPPPHALIALKKSDPRRGAILRYDAHPPSWLVVLAGQQKRSQKLGDFLQTRVQILAVQAVEDASYPLCITLCTVRMYLHAIVTLISLHRLLGSSLPLPSAMVAQLVSTKLGLGQIS